MNPLFIEYYSHEDCECYKVDIPWSEFNRETIVLCMVSEGIEKARRLATSVLSKRLEASLYKEVESK